MDIWKENLLEEIKAGEVKFELERNLLMEIKRKFNGGYNELTKVAESKQVE